MLGTDAVPILSRQFEIIAPPEEQFDITDLDTVMTTICKGKFDIVLHMAALTDLDWCEDNPDRARLVNTEGTKNIALACAKAGCRMAYISTSGIFSGRMGRPYTEEDNPKPANVYGMSKHEAEIVIQESIQEENWLILRVGWLFGGGKKDKKFVGKMFQLMMTTSKVMAVADIWGSPNYSVDIGYLLENMFLHKIHGLFHIANTGEPASRYDMALAIRDSAQLPVEIEAVPSSRFPTRAFRPPMEAIKSVRLINTMQYTMRNWRDALDEYIKRLAKINAAD
mgnify:CR=1 FL=1